jgi:hypothetical protein
LGQLKNVKEIKKMRAKYLKTMISVILTLSLVMGLSSVAVPAKEAQAAGKYTLKQKNISVEVGAIACFCAKYNADFGKLSGYNVGSATIEVISGKDKVAVDQDKEFTPVQGWVYGIKKGVATIKITAKYLQYTRKSEKEEYKTGKTLATVSTTFKVTVKARSSVKKSKLKMKDKTSKVKKGSTYEDYYGAVYNKPRSSYAQPEVSYKIISGGDCVRVKTSKSKNELKIKGIAAGEAKIKCTVTWKLYNEEYNRKLSSKWKLANKKYYTSTRTLTVKVTGGSDDSSSDDISSAVTGSSISN